MRVAAGRFPFQRTRLDIPVALVLLTSIMGVWAAYDSEAASAKFWLVVGGILIYYSLARQPQVNLWALASLFGLIGIGVAAFFLLTHDWTQAKRIVVLDEIGLWWMSVRPTYRIQPIHRNIEAGIMAMMSPFIVAVGLRGWQDRRIGIVSTQIAAAVLILISLLLTTSRGAWVALGTAFGIWVLWGLSNHVSRLKRWSRGRIYALALISLFSIFVWLVSTYPGGVVGLADRLPGPPHAGSRLELARDTLDLIADFPFTGGGLVSFPGLYSHYILVVPGVVLLVGHNIYLDTTLELGPLGLLAICSLLLGSGWLLLLQIRQVDVSSPRNYILRWASLTSLIVMATHGIVDNGHSGVPILFLLVGIAVALARTEMLQYPERSELAEKNSRSIQGSFKRLWKITGVVIALVIAVAMLYSFRKPLLANWYSNLGALKMARIELAGWPIRDADDDQILGSLDAAEALFRKALQLNPNIKTAQHRLGLISLRRHDFEAAKKHLEQAFQLDRNHLGIWRSLGSSYVRGMEFNQVNFFDEGMPLSELDAQNDVFGTWVEAVRDPHDWLWLAYEATEAGNDRFAVALLERQAIGGRALAFRIVEAAKKGTGEFSRSFQHWVGIGDNDSLRVAAEQATADGRLDDALLAYHALSVINEENGVSPLALFLWHEANDLPAAEMVLRQALEIYPNSRLSIAWFRNLGRLMRVQMRWEEAEEAYRKVLIEDPEDMFAHIGLGWIWYERDDDLELALEEFLQAIEFEPNRIDGYYAVGQVFEREKRFLEAAPWFERALELNPGNEIFKEAVGRLEGGGE